MILNLKTNYVSKHEVNKYMVHDFKRPMEPSQKGMLFPKVEFFKEIEQIYFSGSKITHRPS